MFQSARPVRDAILILDFRYRLPRVSIRASREGRDLARVVGSSLGYEFQSARPVRDAMASTLGVSSRTVVSIRASREGRDTRKKLPKVGF